MVLNSKSWLVRWAYSLYGPAPEERYGPPTTTLCAFFWRAFVFVPLTWAAIVGLICLILYSFYMELMIMASIVGAIIVPFLLLIDGDLLTGWFDKWRWDKWEEDNLNRQRQPSVLNVFLDGIVAFKSKFCLIIYFKS